MVFEKLCVLVLWTKVVSALEGLRVPLECIIVDVFYYNMGIQNNLAHSCLRVPLECIIVDAFEYDMGIQNNLDKLLDYDIM